MASGDDLLPLISQPASARPPREREFIHSSKFPGLSNETTDQEVSEAWHSPGDSRKARNDDSPHATSPSPRGRNVAEAASNRLIVGRYWPQMIEWPFNWGPHNFFSSSLCGNMTLWFYIKNKCRHLLLGFWRDVKDVLDDDIKRNNFGISWGGNRAQKQPYYSVSFPHSTQCKVQGKQLMAVLLGVSKFSLINTRKGIEADWKSRLISSK